ncbi:MAG TPA: Maf family nucleotide pyrophosphatase [Hyphomicrobiaceae bacterium]|jgi:septum formation protein|nr:Maf family nucleotide pyrophosphatase [Hyphomicrobiaceae bacterium]
MRKPETGKTGELLLASASPFRRRMLEAAGVPFRVVPAEVDESALKRSLAGKVAPEGLAEALAAAKAEAVSGKFPADLVIGADQVLALGDETFGKPHDLIAARAQLERLRGRTHRLLSAVALARGGRVVWSKVDTASLTVRELSAAFLDEYLARCGERLLGIAGAYEIEGLGIQLFDRVEGDYFTIVGLPLLPLLAELRARAMVQA